MADFMIKRGDTLPEFERTLTDASGAVDLSGASVAFRMASRDSGTTVVDRSATIVSASTGIVKYAWQAGDTATAGTYSAEFRVTFGDGRILTFPNVGTMSVEIAPNIPAAS